ncbi:multiubiquitin domain-containing protein [Rhodovulum sp. PH10]|uniref:multiubiquitin domain-containing protein n=1 Tax=Rhodovulum sp. PH10 TaxID=1187851 RepID=UPI000A04186A|nr:multiubiquitin domain-containing protein [Rhodovulum sp. PH10]
MEQQHADQGVQVHIDQHAYTSPTPTTGAALYALAHLGDEDELYREVDGNREDELVAKDGERFYLRADEHFHSAKQRERAFKIVINGEPVVVRKRVLTFDEITRLTFPGLPTGPQIVFTVTFKKAAGPLHQGTLLPSGTVKIKNGTIFNVTRTDKS